MIENMFQHKLKELRQHFGTLEQLSRENPWQVRELLPGVLARLQRSVEELQAIVADLPRNEPLGSSAFAQSQGERSREARPGRRRRLRAMARRAPLLVRIMSSPTRCRWANRAWLEFTGRSLKHLLGEGWLRDVHPEDRDRCIRNCHEATHASRLTRMEYRLQRKNGAYGWVLEIGTPRLTSRGTDGGYLGTAIEITGHKQAETHLAVQYAVANLLSEASTLEEAAAPILQILCETLGWDVAELWSVDPGEYVPHCTQLWASPALDVSELLEGMRSRVFPPSAGSPWQLGNPVWIADITIDETHAQEPEARRVGLHGMFRLPVHAFGQIRAILRVFSRGILPKDDAVAKLMTWVGVQIGQVLERQHSVDTIQESEARKAALLDASLDAVITIDHDGHVVEFNRAAETIFGYRREDAVGRELVALLVPPRLREQAMARISRYRATGKSGLPGKRFEALAMKADGSEFPVEVAMAPPGSGNQPLLTIYVCDATVRKHAEHEVRLYQERLRSLMADLLMVEERERRRLAIDLHDGLSQTIALTQIKLSALRRSVTRKQAGLLDEIKDLLDQANQAARSVSFELSPPVLHDLGLEPAVQWLVENVQARYGIEIVLKDDGQPKPADEKTKVILFRSIRELLINAAKHAGAHRVHVCLERDQDHLNAAVEDDGIGMEPGAVGVEGSGLFSIRERLSHVGGSMRIESAPGSGTRILLCAPLTNTRPTKARMET